MIETKNNAESIAAAVDERVEVDRDVRIHWTGCPNSCGQVQAADIVRPLRSSPLPLDVCLPSPSRSLCLRAVPAGSALRCSPHRG